MRETSREAYQAIVDGKLLPEMQLQAYRALIALDSATGRELNDYLDTSNAHKRLSELRNKGLAVETSPGTCRITGKRSIKWVAIVNLPENKKKKKQIDSLKWREERLIRALSSVRKDIKQIERLENEDPQTEWRNQYLWEDGRNGN